MKMFSNICLLSLSLSLQVFGTNVMVTVAKSFEAPIKCKYETETGSDVSSSAECQCFFIVLNLHQRFYHHV